MSDEEVGDVNKTFGNKYLYIREKKKKVERNMGTFSAIIIEEQPRKKVCLSFFYIPLDSWHLVSHKN